REFLETAVDIGLTTVLFPALEREVRRELTAVAHDHAIEIFSRNLRSLLLQPPLRGKRVLAIDPGFPGGCKFAALDGRTGLIDEAVIYPLAPQKKIDEARKMIRKMICDRQLGVIAIGNGNGCREIEEIVSQIITDLEAYRRGEPLPDSPPKPAPVVVISSPESTPDTQVAISLTDSTAVPVPDATPQSPQPGATTTEGVPTPEPTPAAPEAPLAMPPEDIVYVIVNEAGASDYSGSVIGREEFPNHDAALRAAVSIGRRLQDPLSELVKIDPQHIGVGLYQHDVNHKHLKETLEGVVASCVNHVGADLNTAAAPLLRHIAGLNPHVAREIVEHRSQHGPFRSREQLTQLPSINPLRFTQAVGFLLVRD